MLKLLNSFLNEVIEIKVVTVNVPESYIDAINKLIGENGLYPSRSELIRVAVREFLLKELRLAKRFPDNSKSDADDYDKEKFVHVPLGDSTFKTFKIVKKLDF